MLITIKKIIPFSVNDRILTIQILYKTLLLSKSRVILIGFTSSPTYDTIKHVLNFLNIVAFNGYLVSIVRLLFNFNLYPNKKNFTF